MTEIYKKRREKLKKSLGKQAILLPGQSESARNYKANAFAFRQDSHFLYFTGISLPDLALLIFPDGKEILFGSLGSPDDLIWHGPGPDLVHLAESGNISHTESIKNLKDNVQELCLKGVKVHYLPPYTAHRTFWLSCLLDESPEKINNGTSEDLIKAVINLRIKKDESEIRQIEDALTVTKKMYDTAFKIVKPGIFEHEIAGAMQGVALAHDRAQAFIPIVSVRGEILHNQTYKNQIKDGQLLLIDSGAESKNFYASDITRTIPVSGKFTLKQKEIYDVVLSAQNAAINMAGNGLTNKDLHHIASVKVASGLKDIGLMKGDVDEAVKNGAHALFFVHGLGHMLGLDAHDMEDLGDMVGYPDGEKRSNQFGLSFLRLTRKFETGYVFTIEPGIYFIPELVRQWAAEKKHLDFINYDVVNKYLDFGGIRIEDDILITPNGSRVLGPPIPK